MFSASDGDDDDDDDDHDDDDASKVCPYFQHLLRFSVSAQMFYIGPYFLHLTMTTARPR